MATKTKITTLVDGTREKTHQNHGMHGIYAMELPNGTHRVQVSLRYDNSYKNQTHAHVDVWSTTLQQWSTIYTPVHTELTFDAAKDKEMLLDLAARFLSVKE